jgi:hypothetical protein
MVMALVLSSVLSGLIATAVMLVFLYLPLLWQGAYYDTLGSIGAIYLRRVDDRSRLLGGITLFAGGIFFAFFYGAFVLMFMLGSFPAPSYSVWPSFPLELNLFYLLVGLVGGFSQGMFMALMTTFIVTDFHPLEAFRNPFTLILSFLIGHVVYGAVAMFFQHQLLQLLLP